MSPQTDERKAMATPRSIQFAAMGLATPGIAVPAAEAAERNGFDIFLLTDSQNLRGDVYSQLALCAKATSSIMLGTGVTNPITRHAAVTATSIMSVQAESGGRAILGIGRGDSAVLHIGRKIASLKEYGAYIRDLQGYLSGGVVDQNGFPSRLRWLDLVEVEKVPVDMVGSGPRSLALAASLADRVTLAVGADLDRLSWGIDTVRQAAKAAGRDADSIPIGAYINVAVGTDRDQVRESIRGGVATFAHFSAGAGTDFARQPEIMRRVTSRLQTEYDTAHHSQGEAPHARIIDQDFIDWFAVAGTVDEVVERLAPIVKLGLSHIYFAGGRAFGTRGALAQEVLPALRAL